MIVVFPQYSCENFTKVDESTFYEILITHYDSDLEVRVIG